MLSIIIKLKSRLIRNAKTRHRYKYIQMAKLVTQRVSRAKWGVSYSVFDGEELLEASIKSIRDSVDYVNVVYQRHSWYGNPADKGLLPLLTRLQKSGLIDELIEYVPNYDLSPGRQERQKRNIGLKYAKRRHINYFMTMDCDEFYMAPDIARAKREIIRRKITHSFCDIANYGIKPTERFLGGTVNYVQFFSKVCMFSKLAKKNKRNITLVDPTRQMSGCWGQRHWFLTNIQMHHMSQCRKNLYAKYENSSAKYVTSKRKKVTPQITRVSVPDYFGLMPLTEKWKK